MNLKKVAPLKSKLKTEIRFPASYDTRTFFHALLEMCQAYKISLY